MARYDAPWEEVDASTLRIEAGGGGWPWRYDVHARFAFRFSEQAAFLVAASPPDDDAVAVEPQTHAPPALRRLIRDEPGAPALLAPGEVLSVEYELRVERSSD